MRGVTLPGPPMRPTHARRLLVGGTVLLVAGWLGLVAVVAPSLFGAVAVAAVGPLALVVVPYGVVRAVTRALESRGWRERLPGLTPQPDLDAERAG